MWPPKTKIAWYLWLGPVLGSTAWLLRLIWAWRELGERDLMWLTVGVYVAFAVVVPILFHRFQKQLGGGIAALVFWILAYGAAAWGLMKYADHQHKLDLLPGNGDLKSLLSGTIVWMTLYCAGMIWIMMSLNAKYNQPGDSPEAKETP